MHKSSFLLALVTIFIKSSTLASRESHFLKKSLEILGKLRVCYGDIFIHVPFSSSAHISLSKKDWSRSEFAYSETQFKVENNSSSSSPNCWIILLITTIEENVPRLIGLISKISENLESFTFRQLQPAIVFLHAPQISPYSESTQLQLQNDLFANASFSLNTNIFNLFFNQEDFSLWEVYNIKKLMKIDKVAEGRVGVEGLRYVKSPAGRRGNFYGQSFIAVIRANQPDWMRYAGPGENITLLDGFSVHVYWNLQTMLNFSAKVVTGEGLITLPNTIGGATADHLNTGTGDISLSISSITPFRAMHLTFLQPVYCAMINCFFMQPAANSIRNIVTAPFQRLVWFSLLGTWFTLLIILKMSSFLKRYVENRQTIKNDKKSELTLSTPPEVLLEALPDSKYENDAAFAAEIGMWPFAANCQKSWHLIPDSFPIRMMFLTGILCGIVSFVAYSGAITSTLTVSIVPVKQFSDLTKFNFFFTVYELSDPFKHFLQLMIDAQNLKQNVLTANVDQEVSHLLDPKKPMAFLTYSDLFYPTALALNYTELFICSRLSFVQVSPVLYKSSLFLKKGSEYTEILNIKTIILKERGFNHRYVKIYERSNIFLCGTKSGTTDPIEFMDVLTAFLLVCGGLIASSILLIVEILYRNIWLGCCFLT